MTFPTHLLYEAAGRPALDTLADVAGVCAVCGEQTTQTCPAPFSDVFTDWDKLRVPQSQRVCAACAFAFLENLRMPGRDRPQRMRNYSHFVVDGRWLPLSKGDKAQMQDILLNPPSGDWLAVIGASGQKHILFRAEVNHRSSPFTIQFEETRIVVTPEALRAVLADVETLYTQFSKTAIQTGDYPQHKVLKFGVDRWHALEQRLAPLRGAPLLELAIFLACLKEDAVGDGEGSRDGSRFGADPAPFDELGRVGREAPEILEHLSGSTGGQRLHQRSGKIHQLGLFEDGD